MLRVYPYVAERPLTEQRNNASDFLRRLDKLGAPRWKELQAIQERDELDQACEFQELELAGCEDHSGSWNV